MGLRVDRQTALGWLGIEGYRPSGRVRLPAPRSMPNDEAREAANADDSQPAEVEGVSQPAPAEVSSVVELDGVTEAKPRDGGDEQAQAQSVAARPGTATASDMGGPVARLTVSTDSPHRALAEAIARVSGLACETDPAGDGLLLDGEVWALSSLAADGQAKRRLWRALVARGRRSRV